MKKVTIRTTVEDFKPVVREQIVDFHARLPMSQRDKLLKVAQEKGVVPNVILRKALEAFGV